jgi:hypothetical protein
LGKKMEKRMTVDFEKIANMAMQDELDKLALDLKGIAGIAANKAKSLFGAGKGIASDLAAKAMANPVKASLMAAGTAGGAALLRQAFKRPTGTKALAKFVMKNRTPLALGAAGVAGLGAMSAMKD